MWVKWNGSKYTTILLGLLIVALIMLPCSFASAQKDDNFSITLAQNTLNTCYSVAKEAEAAGANITSLQETLNTAGLLLSRAELSNAQSNTVLANDYAQQVQNVLADFIPHANSLRDTASQMQQTNFLLNLGSIAGAFGVVGASLVVWFYLKTKAPKLKIDLSRFKVIFFVIVAILTLFVASPAVQRVLVFPQTESFTEFCLLGSNQKVENYPHTVTNNGDYRIFLGISNNLGSCGYYLVQTKFRNQSLEGPDVFGQTPSTLPVLYAMNVFVADKQTVMLPIDFSFDYTIDDSTINFNYLSLNNVNIALDGHSTTWNQTTQDFYGKLVFELYLYNSALGLFEYHGRYVDLGLDLVA
ncbi:MAG: DUF1616 domain-containing protein [Nitrososphaerota archaeon]|jgi:hypothetical protein|nr:DUF1616 domain-containing protein [Nitrososphaerota archaeon]